MNQSVSFAGVVQAVEDAGLFVSLATVQLATNTKNSVGQVDLTPTGFATISGCVNIPCMRAPLAVGRPMADQVATPQFTMADNEFHVLLDGYFPQIPEAEASTGDLQIIIDGVYHEVCGVESDSQFTMTRIRCKQVAV